MFTNSYHKIIKVSDSDSEYFYVHNIDVSDGTITIKTGNTIETATTLGFPLEYSFDKINWITADPNELFTLSVPAGAKVYMRGELNNNITNFYMDVLHNVGGNIISLIDKNNYITKTTANSTRYFREFFKNDTNLVNAGDMNFGHIEEANWYFNTQMFQGCTSLTTPPTMKYMKVMWSGYYMFQGCTSLTTPMDLSNITGTGGEGFDGFYRDCSSLTKIIAPNIAIPNYLAAIATDAWVNGVAANGTFYKPAGKEWISNKQGNGIPSGWAVVEY